MPIILLKEKALGIGDSMTKKVLKNELKVFIASPSDVSKERDAVDEVLNAINQGMAADRKLLFTSYRWEKEYPRAGDAQEHFTEKIKDCVLFVAIFWRRIGRPKGAKLPSTVEEVQEALKQSKNQGTPKVMVYFSNRPFKSDNPEDFIQKARVLEFQEQMNKDPKWKALYRKYKTVGDFESVFRQDVEKWLSDFYDLSQVVQKKTTHKKRARVPLTQRNRVARAFRPCLLG